MKEKKTPIGWYTTKSGKHIPIFEKDDKQAQIKKNEEEAKELNHSNINPSTYVRKGDDVEKLDIPKGSGTVKLKEFKRKSYSEYEDINDACMEFYKNTGININGAISVYNKESLCRTMDTLQDLQDKFTINKTTPSTESTSKYKRLDLLFYPDTEDFVANGGEDTNEFTFAYAGGAYVAVNPRYYALPPKDLDDIYEQGTVGMRPHHPSGTTGKDIIVHEVGHTLLNRWMYERTGFNLHSKEFENLYNWCDGNIFYSDWETIKDPILRELHMKFNKCKQKLVGDEKAFERYMGKSSDRYNILQLAHPMTGGKYALCEYSAKNYHELIAECFADFYSNGKNCKPISAIVMDEFFGFKL